MISFSRSLRPGSIAAGPSSPTSGTGPSFPGLSGRAPLRRRDFPGDGDASGGRFPGLSGRAPLRLRHREIAQYIMRDVFPVSQAGLHCGESGGAGYVITCGFSRSLRPGSIAAWGQDFRGNTLPTFSRSLRPGSIAACCGAVCLCVCVGFPGLSGRAPLRPRGQTSGFFALGEFSRSLRPGSIAASCAYRIACGRSGVFPVSQAGLHCGDGCALKNFAEFGGFPGLSGRAPLRPGHVPDCPDCPSCFPGLSGRAPLRPDIEAAGLDAIGWVSRSLRPGSIAASHLTCSGRFSHLTFSRSLRPGSIAACYGKFAQSIGFPSFPGLSGRAPLRPAPSAVPFPAPSGFPGLSGRAPLRLSLSVSHGPTLSVFPVSQAGLHCGFFREATVLTGGVGFPGLSGRAPLRHPGQWDDPICTQVFPVSQAGLHCGGPEPGKFRREFCVFPVSQAGLHCGPFVQLPEHYPE